MTHKATKRKRKTNRIRTISGILVAKDWNPEGKPISLALLTYDEDEYIIGTEQETDSLIHLLQKKVEIRGCIRIQKGMKTIIVSTWNKKMHTGPRSAT